MNDDAEVLEEVAPHTKENMTSRFGRMVERIGYVDIIILAAFVLTVTTLWFDLGPNGQTLKDSGASLFACAYFALVTFTTLGYGEMVPVGFGRVVAILDVVSGLALTAIFIGKVASERQSSLLLLLHTSDTQRRIAKFGQELESARAAQNGF